MGGETPVKENKNHDMEYFIIKDRSQQGPYTLEQLAEAGLTSGTLVWREGMGQWTPAWQVEELKGILSGKAQQRPAPPPPPVNETEADNTGYGRKEPGTEPATVHCGKRRRRAAIWLAVAAVAFFAMLMTCPTEDEHQEAVANEISTALADSAGRMDTGSAMLDALGGMLGNAIASQIVNAMVSQMLTVDDYFIVSIGKIHYEGTTKTVSLGILGHVFTFDSTDVSNAVGNWQDIPGTMAIRQQPPCRKAQA